nr:MAG TPA: hypothetical protein [Caudoviricetes sp.]
MKVKNYRAEYDYKFLACGSILATDVSNNTSIPQSTAYYFKVKPERILKARSGYIDEMFQYFKSLGLDENKLDRVTRETRVVFLQK